jgi:SAM-dependent methyltransferase
MTFECRLCQSKHVKLLIDFGNHPIIHHLLRECDEKYEVFPFQLGYCENCQFLQLLKPISPAILYENYFTFSSWKNQPHVERLINVMKSVSDMNPNSRLLEIGCNDGSFLDSLRAHGINKCIGIEPSKDAYHLAKAKGFNVYNNFFSINNIEIPLRRSQFDIVVTRQVLEHITDLSDFISSIEYVLKDDGILVIEVPDSDCNIRCLDYALWEEHVNYFTLNTLRKLLNKFDFEIFHNETTLFSGKALTVFAEKRCRLKDIENDKNDMDSINIYKKYLPEFKLKLHEMLSDKENIIVYGCGARSCTFVNFMELDKVEAFVDDQKEKQKHFVPGCGLEIIPYEPQLSECYTILGVGAENEMKVIRKRNLDRGKCASILPPSRFLPNYWKEMINV